MRGAWPHSNAVPVSKAAPDQAIRDGSGAIPIFLKPVYRYEIYWYTGTWFFRTGISHLSISNFFLLFFARTKYGLNRQSRKPTEKRFWNTVEGSFSAVSKPIFAFKYSFESSRRDLHNALEWNPLHRFGIESQKTRKTMGGEKILVQSRENRPGEAHRQLQLTTQCYPRARSRIITVL